MTEANRNLVPGIDQAHIFLLKNSIFDWG